MKWNVKNNYIALTKKELDGSQEEDWSFNYKLKNFPYRD